MESTELLKYFSDRQSGIISEITELVDIESPSFDVGASASVANWLQTKISTISDKFEIERHMTDVGEHMVIRAFPGDGPHTLILGHTDTVHPTGTNIENPTRLEGDKLFGCGVFDMKANVVLVLEALRLMTLKGLTPSTPITLLLSCDEEVGSATGREFVEREAAGAARCFVLEPSAAGRVKTGRKGTAVFSLKAHGVPAHAGLEPEKGANAIAELARHIDEVHAIARPEIGTTVNVTTFRGGTTTNVIPEHAVFEIDVRFSSMAEGERVESELRQIVSNDPSVTIEMLGAINRPPLERTDAVVKLFEKARSLAASFAYELGETQVGGASDGNFVAAMGVPVLDGLGIAGDGAHTLYEHILVSDIANRATLTTLLMIEQ